MSLEGHSILAYRHCGVWFRAGGNQIRVQVHNKELSCTPQTQPVAEQIPRINQSSPALVPTHAPVIAMLLSCRRCGV